MKAFALLSALAAVSGVVASPTLAKRDSLTSITTKGTAFYAGDKRFFIRGIDYQPGGSAANKDPLADKDVCTRDIKYFKQLGINSIRVYTVDNSANHDDCMQALEDAGIYLILDVNNSGYSINQIDPFPSYNAKYLQSVFATVEMFAKYNNTLAFFSGNEVISDKKGTDKAAPYVKAVTRDIKNYINSRGLRKIPVGYSAADVSSNRMQTAEYMNCGSDDMRSDFFAFNDYSWCDSDFETAGWDQKVKNFTDYGLPIFLSEYGCIKNRPRTFGEMGALMSDKMTAVYSGGLLYEYSNEDNDFGIVDIKNDAVSTLKEFGLFETALSKYPSPTDASDAASTTHAVSCPPSNAGWEVDPSEVPVMPEQAEKYMKDGAGDGPGLSGDGSQQAGDSGTATASTTGGEASPTGSGGSSSDDEGAGVSVHGGFEMAPLMVSGVTLFFTLFGALLL